MRFKERFKGRQRVRTEHKACISEMLNTALATEGATRKLKNGSELLEAMIMVLPVPYYALGSKRAHR
jgi:hypothetical protein